VPESASAAAAASAEPIPEAAVAGSLAAETLSPVAAGIVEALLTGARGMATGAGAEAEWGGWWAQPAINAITMAPMGDLQIDCERLNFCTPRRVSWICYGMPGVYGQADRMYQVSSQNC
jgi:hypothetical protein